LVTHPSWLRLVWLHVGFWIALPLDSLLGYSWITHRLRYVTLCCVPGCVIWLVTHTHTLDLPHGLVALPFTPVGLPTPCLGLRCGFVVGLPLPQVSWLQLDQLDLNLIYVALCGWITHRSWLDPCPTHTFTPTPLRLDCYLLNIWLRGWLHTYSYIWITHGLPTHTFGSRIALPLPPHTFTPLRPLYTHGFAVATVIYTHTTLPLVGLRLVGLRLVVPPFTGYLAGFGCPVGCPFAPDCRLHVHAFTAQVTRWLHFTRITRIHLHAYPTHGLVTHTVWLVGSWVYTPHTLPVCTRTRAGWLVTTHRIGYIPRLDLVPLPDYVGLVGYARLPHYIYVAFGCVARCVRPVVRGCRVTGCVWFLHTQLEDSTTPFTTQPLYTHIHTLCYRTFTHTPFGWIALPLAYSCLGFPLVGLRWLDSFVTFAHTPLVWLLPHLDLFTTHTHPVFYTYTLGLLGFTLPFVHTPLLDSGSLPIAVALVYLLGYVLYPTFLVGWIAPWLDWLQFAV